MRYCILCIECILFGVCLWASWSFITQQMHARSKWTVQTTPQVERTIAPKKLDTTTLTSFDPFYRVAAAVADDALEIKQETGAEVIRLFGTNHDSAGIGSAILQIGENSQFVAKTGDEIQPGISLSEVADDHIVLMRSQNISVLYFEEIHPTESWSDAYEVKDSNEMAASKKQFNSKAAIKDAIQSLSLVNFNSEQIGSGFRIAGAKDFKIIEDLGLQQGDILLQVNGTPLQSKADLLAIADTYSSKSSVRLGVFRPDQKRSFVLYVS